MFRTKLLLILPLVVAVTVGQANRGYSYYGTSNVRDQRPQPIYGERRLLLPGRPMPVTGPVTAAPEAIITPAPILDGPSAPAVPPAKAAPSYAPVFHPRPIYTSVYRPPLPPRPIRPALPAVTPPQPSANGEPQPPVTEAAPLLEPLSEIRQPGPISQPEPIWQPEPVPQTEPIRESEWDPSRRWVQIQQPEYALQPEPTQKIVQAQEPSVHPERDAVPFPEPPPTPLTAPPNSRSINVAQSPTPMALPPLLPKPQNVWDPAFGRMIYYPNVTYPSQTPSYSYSPTPPRSVTTTQAPPVVVTAHPVMTQATGKLELDFQCKEGNGYYSVEHECDTYIECKQNRAMKYTCPDGLHFNHADEHVEYPFYPCAYPSEAKCMPGDHEQNPTPTAKCPNLNGLYSMNDGDCSQYISCQGGSATIMNCPMGLAFNPKTSSCDWPVNVPQCNPDVFKDFTCPAPPKNKDGQVSDIIYKYRYEGQCKLYIACQLGYPRLLSCKSGFSFNDASQTCIDEAYVTDCVENVQ